MYCISQRWWHCPRPQFRHWSLVEAGARRKMKRMTVSWLGFIGFPRFSGTPIGGQRLQVPYLEDDFIIRISWNSSYLGVHQGRLLKIVTHLLGSFFCGRTSFPWTTVPTTTSTTHAGSRWLWALVPGHACRRYEIPSIWTLATEGCGKANHHLGMHKLHQLTAHL